MANIQVADLNLSGSDLLLGEESFLSELSDEQANLLTVESPISGGWHSGCVCLCSWSQPSRKPKFLVTPGVVLSN